MTAAWAKRLARLCLVAGTALAGALPAQAFDCAKARSRAERATCADPAAKASDDALNAAFDKLRGTLSGAELKALVANQRTWLKMRDRRCEEAPAALAACIRGRNAVRTRALLAQPDAGPGTPEPLVPVVVDRPGSKLTYAVNLFLFRFASPRTPAETLLNTKVRSIVAAAPTRTDDPKSPTPFEWERKARIAYASDRLLSIRIDGYEMTGGAHPNPTLTGINIDMKAGRELTLDDLLEPRNRGAVAGICEEQVGRQLRDKVKEGGDDPDSPEGKAMLKDLAGDAGKGVADTIADLGNWTFGAQAAEVTFMPYAVAPYAYGSFSCTLPYAELRPLAKASFPLP